MNMTLIFGAKIPACLNLKVFDFKHGQVPARKSSRPLPSHCPRTKNPRAVVENAEEQGSKGLLLSPPTIPAADAHAADNSLSPSEFNSSPLEIDSEIIDEKAGSYSAIVSSLWELAERQPSSSPSTDKAFITSILSAVQAGPSYPEIWPTGSLIASLEALGRMGMKDPEVLTPFIAALTERAQHDMHWTQENTIKMYSSLAALRIRPSGLVGALAKRLNAPETLENLRLLAMQRLFHSLAILEWPVSAETLRLLGTHFLPYHRAMLDADTCGLVWIIARRGEAVEDLLTAFAPAVHAVLPRCSMKQLADISRAYAKYPTSAVGGLFESIAARAARCIDGAAPEDIARVISAFDQVDIQPEALLIVVEEWADRRLAALSPQALALALASFVRLNNRSPRLLRTAAACARSKITEMQRHELALVLWAFARLEFDPGEELRNHAEHALASAPAAFDDRELSNLIWALARLGHLPSADSLAAICTGFDPLAGKCMAVSASLVLWSFATFNYRPPSKLTIALGSAVARDLRPLDPQTIALTSWALGTLGMRHEQFAHAVSVECSARSGCLDKFAPQNLANLAWGLAKAGSNPGKSFMNELQRVSVPRLKEFSQEELFCLCWSFATLRHASEPLGIAAAAELRERHSEFGALELSGMLWSLARMLCPEQDTPASWAAQLPAEVHRESYQSMHSTNDDNSSFEITSYSSEQLQPPPPAAAAVAATWILSTGDREIPGQIGAMESSQIAMTVWGLGRLTRGLEFVHDSVTPKRPSASTLEVLREAVGQAAPSLSIPSLVATVEGLARLRAIEIESEGASQLWGGIFEALGKRSIAVAPELRPSEFSSLVFHLTRIGQNAAARVLLERQAGDLKDFKLSPKGMVLMLGAMARSGACPWSLLAAARSRLNRLSDAYSMEGWCLEVLYDALEELYAQHGKRVHMSEKWQERVQAAGEAARLRNRRGAM